MLVFDIDQTICFDRYTIPPTIHRAIMRAKADNRIVFASARHPRDMYRVPGEELAEDAWLIGCNGAIAFQDHKVSYARPLQWELTGRILELLEETGTSYLADGIFTSCREPETGHALLDEVTGFGRFHITRSADMDRAEVIKILFLPGIGADPDLMARLDAFNGVDVHRHRDGSIDITVSGIDKWAYLSRLKTDDRAFAAFGDDTNDLMMLRAVRFNVVVGDRIGDCVDVTHRMPDDARTEHRIARLIETCSGNLLLEAGAYALKPFTRRGERPLSGRAGGGGFARPSRRGLS
ncbi:HAD-IIB family hydrolase [Breoghania sp.]|uniref:HAD-IIB family hydrolase n=1 Tax=Breoghania sp. TaxID=2065378 RepID=UPI002635718B|nr:HAD-IIB family hydrolase [Breoghania sp.]MDJ0933569.1 HAD-IIB family hydrolase [Breoghania sp.]